MVEERIVCGRSWASWASIIAGVITTMAVCIVMDVLGMALGFAIIDPMSAEPFAGLGLTFGIWAVLSILISLAAGGFVAGLITGIHGYEHGFLVWATSLVIATIIGTMALGMAVKTLGTAAGSLASGAVTVASHVGEGVAGATGDMISKLEHALDDVNTGRVRGDVMGVLRDTEVETLQPAYLHQQLREARSDLRRGLNQLRLNPDAYEDVISQFLQRQERRVQNITRDVDREAAVNALMRNRQISRMEAEQQVNSALGAYRGITAMATDALDEVRQELSDAREYLDDLAAQARVEAEQASRALSKMALAAAVALIFGALASIAGGRLGSRYALRWWD